MEETLSMHLSTIKIIYIRSEKEKTYSPHTPHWVSFEVAMQLINVSVATIRHDA